MGAPPPPSKKSRLKPALAFGFGGHRIYDLHLVATALLKKVANARSACAQNQTIANQKALAKTLNDLGRCFDDHQGWDESRPLDEEATAIYRILARSNPKAYDTMLANSLYHLGVVLRNLGHGEEACKTGEEAVILLRHCYSQHSNTFNSTRLQASLKAIFKTYEAIGRSSDAGRIQDEMAALKSGMYDKYVPGELSRNTPDPRAIRKSESSASNNTSILPLVSPRPYTDGRVFANGEVQTFDRHT